MSTAYSIICEPEIFLLKQQKLAWFLCFLQC